MVSAFYGLKQILFFLIQYFLISVHLQISKAHSSCCKSAKSVPNKQYKYAWLPAIVVAILPKCPFCVMAYSGAITMCSGNSLYPNESTYMSYITMLLALVVLIGILFNFRGGRTKIALLIAISGLSFVFISQFIIPSSLYYYIGVLLLFFGIWYNGSFFYFYRKLLPILSKN